MSTASSDETEGFKIKKEKTQATVRITYSACKVQRIELTYERQISFHKIFGKNSTEYRIFEKTNEWGMGYH